MKKCEIKRKIKQSGQYFNLEILEKLEHDPIEYEKLKKWYLFLLGVDGIDIAERNGELRNNKGYRVKITNNDFSWEYFLHLENPTQKKYSQSELVNLRRATYVPIIKELNEFFIIDENRSVKISKTQKNSEERFWYHNMILSYDYDISFIEYRALADFSIISFFPYLEKVSTSCKAKPSGIVLASP